MLRTSILAEMAKPLFGQLAWGQIPDTLKAVNYFPTIRPPVTEVFYVGDLDGQEMGIAADLQRTSTSLSGVSGDTVSPSDAGVRGLPRGKGRLAREG